MPRLRHEITGVVMDVPDRMVGDLTQQGYQLITTERPAKEAEKPAQRRSSDSKRAK